LLVCLASGKSREAVVERLAAMGLRDARYATAIDPRGAFKQVAGLAIGFVLIFDILVGGPLTGAAMNPARAFGPSLLAGIVDVPPFLRLLGRAVGGRGGRRRAVSEHHAPRRNGDGASQP